MSLCYFYRSCGHWSTNHMARNVKSGPAGAFRRSTWDNRTIAVTSPRLVAVSEQSSNILVRTVSNTWTGKDWNGVKSLTKAPIPAPN